MFRRIEQHTAAAIVVASLGLALLAPRASANWTSLPGAVQLSSVPAHIQVATAPDGLGGMFVAWDDSVGTTDDKPVKVQHLDSHGNALWAPGGITLDNGSVEGTGVDLCYDNSGGVFVSYIRYENTPFLSFVGFRVRVTHLDGSGSVTSGFPESLSADEFVRAPAIASDGGGGAIVTWINDRDQVTGCAPHHTLWAQRVDGAGNRVWAAGGVRVTPVGNVATKERDSRALRAATSGSGAYFVWTDACAPFIDNLLVRVQRLDMSTGLPTFDPSGLAFHTGSVPTAYAIPTSGGDCLATVLDPANDSFEYRIGSNGTTAWSRELDQFPTADGGAAASDGQGGVLVTWYDPGDGEMVQRVDAAGVLKLPQLNSFDHGMRCGDGAFEPIGYPACIVSDGKGGAILATPCNHPNNSFRELFSQGVNDAGRPAFRASGLQVSISGQSAICVSGVPGLINNALFAWGNGNGVWAQQVTLSDLDVLTPPPGWDAALVPRANAGATAGSVGATVLIAGDQTWLNWAVLQRGPNPTAAFQSRVYLDGNPTSSMFWGQNVGDGANPGYYPVLNFGPFDIPGGPHTLTLYSDEEFGPDFSVDEGTESNDVWGRQWIWEPSFVLASGPEPGPPIGGFPGSSSTPNGLGLKMRVPGATPGAPNAWVVSNAARRGPTFGGISGGVVSYGDSYGLLMYDLPAGAGEFTHRIGESHQPFNGTNFVLSMVPALPDSLYPLEVRDSTADANPDSSLFDLEFAGTRAGPAAGSSWLGQTMVKGELADIYVLTALIRQTLHLSLTRRESPAGGDRPLAFEMFPPALEGQTTFARGGGMPSLAMSADIETLTFVAPRTGPYLVVVYRTDGSNAGTPLTYDFLSSGSQTLDVPGAAPRLEFAFAGAEPNPVRTGTEFAFTMPAAGAASLGLYDVSGRLVREFVRGTLAVGQHRVHWDGRGEAGARLGAGLYLARLSCGGRTLVRRVALVP